MELTVTKN